MDQLPNDILSTEAELRIESETAGYLVETSKWAKFIAITFFIVTGLVILFFLSYSSALSGLYTRRSYSYGSDYEQGFFIGMVIVMILVVVIVGVTYYFLLNFANKMRSGVDTENIELVNNGLRSLKIHFVIIGILLILGVLVALYNISKL